MFRHVKHANLLEKAEHVLVGPLLGELPSSNAVDHDGGHLKLVTCPWSTGKVPFMRAVRGKAGHNFIAFGNLIFNVMISRRSCLKELERLLQSFTAHAIEM